VTRELNTPRTLSFSGIIKARKKEIRQMGSDQLGVPTELLGLKGSPTIVSELNTQKESNRQAEIFSGTRDEKADMLVQKLVDTGVL
jgi:electron transfer flavoprotein beta subunit